MNKLVGFISAIILLHNYQCNFSPPSKPIDPALLAYKLPEQVSVGKMYSEFLMKGGGDLEKELVQKCLEGSIDGADIQTFLNKGGKLNAWVDFHHVYTERKWAADIPILNWFVGDPNVTREKDYRLNPFNAMMLSKVSDKKKFELGTFMLANGAKPWLRVPAPKDSLYALEILLARSSRERASVYTLQLIDSLLAHKADPTKVRLHFLRNQTQLIHYMLIKGSDPQTIDINDLLQSADVRDTDFVAILKYNLDYADLWGISLFTTCRDPEAVIDLMIENGFNVNQELKGGHYLIESAIRLEKLAYVKMLVEKGATKCIGKMNPYDYAIQYEQGNQVILEYLSTKFKSQKNK